MKHVINAVLVALVLVAGLLALKLLRGSAESPPPPIPPLAVEKCDEARRAVPALRPELSAARLEVLGAVPVRVDGAAHGATLRAGLHILEANDAKLQVQVEPFAEVLIEPTVVGNSTFLLVFGARCATCKRAETEPEFKFSLNAVGSVDAMVRALGSGDWSTAVQQLRSVPPDDRETPELRRAIAAVYVLSGQSRLAREWLDAMPKKDPLHAALRAMEERESKVGDRQFATAADRWNAVSERYQRLSDAFAKDAGPQMSELSKKFNGYSDRFLAATTAKDAIESEVVLREASEAVEAAVTALRAMKSDCAWQKRVWSAL